jgi:hypothetical protein
MVATEAETKNRDQPGCIEKASYLDQSVACVSQESSEWVNYVVDKIEET